MSLKVRAFSHQNLNWYLVWRRLKPSTRVVVQIKVKAPSQIPAPVTSTVVFSAPKSYVLASTLSLLVRWEDERDV